MGERLKAAPASVPRTMRALGWAAGFYEGEGSVTFAVRSHRITVTQVQREPLERMLRLLGGHIYAIKAAETGSEHIRFMSKPSWRWIAYGARARGIMMTLYPMLSPNRRAQVRKVLAMGEVRTQRRS